MHQSIPAAPSPRPRADPRALAFFLPWMANSRGWGLLSCQIPWGGDEKKEGECPILRTLGSRGYFFLMDTDGSRRSRINEAQSAEETFFLL